MCTVIVKVTCRGLAVSTTEWRAPSPGQPGGADTAHAEFGICDQSIEQDHRFLKRRVNPSLGFGSFWTAQRTIQGYEAMHMIRKGQLHDVPKGDILTQN
jgi:transposase-like protein